MAPLIIHHVPEDEQYIGPDGIRRPYAVYDSSDATISGVKPRRVVPETGSFGKSRQRSRSRTGTPAAKREDPTLAAADAIFSQFVAQRSAENAGENQRKSSLSSAIAQPNLSSSGALAQIDGNGGSASRRSKEPHKEPTEVILRGYRGGQQYAALREYERIAGRICEHYSREPPPEQLRFKNEVREPVVIQRRAMTLEEKAKVNKFAGGEHWIKITFESAEAAEIAIESSPQTILGHLIYAELYRGVPPTTDEATPTDGRSKTPRKNVFTIQSLATAAGADAQTQRASSTLPRSFATGTPAMREIGRGGNSLSPESQSSTTTLDTGTIASTTSSSTLLGTQPTHTSAQDDIFCKRIPTAKKIKLIEADKALLPQTSFTKRVISSIPMIGWLGVDPIGHNLPLNDQGEFDYAGASLYWKLMYWIEYYTGIPAFGGNLKEE